MFELITSYAIYIATFVTIMGAIKYISYKLSIKSIHHIFNIFSKEHKGTLNKGSFLVAPSISFLNESKMPILLRSYYLYKGRRGNYTEISLKLNTIHYLLSFNIEVTKDDNNGQWITSITDSDSENQDPYNTLISLLIRLAEESGTNFLTCEFNGESISIKILQLFDKIKQLNDFYNHSQKPINEAMNLASRIKL